MTKVSVVLVPLISYYPRNIFVNLVIMHIATWNDIQYINHANLEYTYKISNAIHNVIYGETSPPRIIKDICRYDLSY